MTVLAQAAEDSNCKRGIKIVYQFDHFLMVREATYFFCHLFFFLLNQIVKCSNVKTSFNDIFTADYWYRRFGSDHFLVTTFLVNDNLVTK